MRINISIPDELLKKIDGYCKAVHDTRSGFISDLVRKELFSRDRNIIMKNADPLVKFRK